MRQAFHKYLDEHWNSDYPLPATVDMDGEQKPIRWLIYRLWNCPDALPRHYYDLLELSGPHSFAAAACRVARELPADPTDDRKYRNTG